MIMQIWYTILLTRYSALSHGYWDYSQSAKDIGYFLTIDQPECWKLDLPKKIVVISQEFSVMNSKSWTKIIAGY